MNFLSPALLIGLLAMAIPPLLHLIHRRRTQVVRFPALEFILRSNRKTARRHRMKQLLLMLVRSLLLGAVAFATARPFLSTEETLEGVGGVVGSTVVVVDVSWPMTYQLDGEPLLARARQQAERLLGQLQGQAALVIAGDEIRIPFSEPTGDLGAVRQALDDLKTGARLGRLPDAVARAYELLADTPAGTPRRVVVLTTAAGAAALPAPPPAPEGQAIILVPVDVAEGRSTPNRAVVDVRARPAPEVGADQWRVEARVANYADTAAERLPIRLEVDGQVQLRGFVTVPAFGEESEVFFARAGEGASKAEVVLDEDALPADDRRPFWLEPAPRLRVLAVNGDPRPTPYADELFYFERALSPEATANTQVKLTVVGQDTFDSRALADQDVVVLANVGLLPPPQVEALVAFVKAGGGLLFTVGNQTQPAETSECFGELLPRTLRDLRLAGDAAASAEGRDRRAAHLTGFSREHPILKPFVDPARSSLGRAEVSRYMLLDPSPDAGGEVVLTLDDGAPLLLTRSLGEGRVALLATTLDRDYTDLPIRPDFVPLIQRLMRYLGRTSEGGPRPALVGQSVPLVVEEPKVLRVRVDGPGGALSVVERPREGGWSFAETTQVGHYQVTPEPPLPGLARLPGFSVALDPVGSNLSGKVQAQPEAQSEVRAALGQGARTELWHGALLALFLLLAAEAVLLLKPKPASPES